MKQVQMFCLDQLCLAVPNKMNPQFFCHVFWPWLKQLGENMSEPLGHFSEVLFEQGQQATHNRSLCNFTSTRVNAKEECA